MDVVSVRVGVDFTGNGGDDVVLLLHTRQLELRLVGWGWYGSLTLGEVRL